MARQLAQSVEEYFNITRTMTGVELLEAYILHRVKLYMEEKMK